ncbi:MAG: TolC family protein [Bacteroidales bacterium]|jgi:outer membrane protein TolC|nr:TolC family protein [Bacteroidales bacterium]
MKKYWLLFVLLFLHIEGVLAQENQLSVFTIDSCIQYAFKNSPYLKARNKEVLIAAKDVDIIKSKRFPLINASGNYFRITQNEYPYEYPSGFAGIELTQSVWKNGKITTLIENAAIGQQMAETKFLIEKNNMISTINQQYLILLKNQELELLSNKITQRIAINLESSKERYKSGIARKSDVLKAETGLSDANFTLTGYTTERKIAEHNLVKTIGADLNHEIKVINTLLDTDFTYTTWELERFYTMALKNLPELKYSDLSISWQNLLIKYEKKTNGPDLDFYAAYSYIYSPVQNNNWSGSLGLALNFTIFNGFEAKNKIAKASIRRDQFEYEKEELLQMVKLEIRQSYLELLEAKQQIENADKQRENSAENLKIANGEYQQGISSMLELLDAENADFTANQNYINALWWYQMAKAAIERKTGISKY